MDIDDSQKQSRSVYCQIDILLGSGLENVSGDSSTTANSLVDKEINITTELHTRVTADLQQAPPLQHLQYSRF